MLVQFPRLLPIDAEPSDAPPLVHGLEETLAALDTHLSDAERRATALLKATRRLRRAAKEGAVASLPAAAPGYAVAKAFQRRLA